MFKKCILAVAALIFSISSAYAAVEANTAAQAALDGIKGVGPTLSKAILAERAKGEFKDWADLEKRVHGIGSKKAVKLSTEGLVVNGQARGEVVATETAVKKKSGSARAKTVSSEAAAQK